LARPSPRYISKYIKIKIVEMWINNIQFGNKTIQQSKFPNSFEQGIIILQKLCRERIELACADPCRPGKILIPLLKEKKTALDETY
jgi:hypothetical protein